MKKLTIVKIGGNILDDPLKLDAFLSLFSRLEGKKILVHGGGKLATRIASELGIETTMVDGRRITNEAMLPVTVMVYAGLLNKQVTAMLQAKGCDALGLSGVDGQVIRTQKREHSHVDFGFVGDIVEGGVNNKKIEGLLSLDFTLVFSAITGDIQGRLLNTNADTVASSLATALAESYDVELVYCFEHRGVLMDVEDSSSVIPQITHESYSQLKKTGVIVQGMIPKIENALEAVNKKVKAVIIKRADDLLINEAGTRIEKSNER